MTGDNAEPLDGWTLPPRCCGEWVSGRTCPICERWAHEIPPNIELGTE